MATATFYLIANDSPQATITGFEHYIVYLAHHFARQGAKVYVHCQDQLHAEQLAERFWQVEPTQFIAHNLIGEGPKYGTPIEIGYHGVKPSYNRQLVINLADNHTTFANAFREVVDFVPCEEKTKQLARERYKIYRQAGYQLQTVELQHP
ncbi:DNA polymerase III subunit chi [Vibrio metschnikovii]|uniref:DNA polymerase III subunit chi n=5 Tax=Unclassified Bacteria TaxID=49928 RepID=A0AAU6SWB9_UNCXX|nr:MULTISPECIES: DNA polymerase III subunit chi [Vibrio]EKO3558446.1 DNA polymerase III subunit chi [Vibrio metschnikovii]EKO3568438.1 DNA polymerase III subunit chi [Vibrio metschnikovii]EKO3575608.1 DNA polymerase III subunit chi [Vibrio metschnikovii]EKO3579905.1 DNA polymerase III subunit chi [Vibrio metschnikovii]EKO3585672.1 DNA polymerase III subunit chi [Vibrio metschnikovii]